MTLEQLLQNLWTDYSTLNPAAQEIHALLTQRGERVLNDHVAYRTYNLPKVGLERMAALFKTFGYEAKGEYHFKEKKLFARHYQHQDPNQPKIFISELRLELCSPWLRETVTGLVNQVNERFMDDPKCLFAGRPWMVTHDVYERLAQESEYAAWMAAWGYRPNHFTVNVNALKTFSTLESLNAFLQGNGHRLNASGGLIKGSPSAFLEQSSTMAREVPVEFGNGVYKIPACYYEFAKRYPMVNGELYQGFIEKSADKIFESTNKAR